MNSYEAQMGILAKR